MATLASSAVTLVTATTTKVPPKLTTRVLKLVLTGEGGLTNTITAAVLGVKKILSCSNLYDKTNGVIYKAAPNETGSLLLLSATTATYDDPDVTVSEAIADVTTTEAYVTIVGYPV
jgi:hypothetical protein